MREVFLALTRVSRDELLLLRGETVELASERAARLLGRSFPELESRPLPELLEDPDAVRAFLRDASRSTSPRPGRLRLPDGTSVRCEGTAVLGAEPRLLLRLWEPGKDSMVLLGQKIEELTSEVQRRKTAQAQAERALEVRDTFLSMASHDLRTPLTTLKLQVQAAIREITLGHLPRPDRWERVGEQVRRLEHLVRNVLDVTRIEQNRLVMRGEDVDMSALVLGCVEELRSEARRASCEVQVRGADGPVPGRWDPDAVGQILVNLLGNAFRYAPGAPVRVELESLDGVVRLRVADGGPGIPPADRERIFERFERAGQEPSGGLGIGLWIVRTLAQEHGGRAFVEDRPGPGTTFLVELPRVR